MALTATNYAFREPLVFRAPANQVDTNPLYAIGTTAKAYDPTYGEVELVYLKAGADDLVGSVVGFHGDYITALVVADGVYSSVGVAIAAKSANKYGWYVTKGNVPAKVLSAFADNANCFLTLTAGSLDDAVVVGDYVYKAKSITAIDTGLAVIYFDESFTTNGIA